MEQIGRIGFAAGIPVTELRPADGGGLEAMFLELTAETQRESTTSANQNEQPHEDNRRPTLLAEHRSLMDVEIITGIPLARIVATELRKMCDTRVWLMPRIATFAVLASIAVVLFAPTTS